MADGSKPAGGRNASEIQLQMKNKTTRKTAVIMASREMTGSCERST